MCQKNFTCESKMDVGGNGGGLIVNNKQRAMLPNKSRGEFVRNQRKDSEVWNDKLLNIFFHMDFVEPMLF